MNTIFKTISKGFRELFSAFCRSSLTICELLKLLGVIRSRRIEKWESNAEAKHQRMKSPSSSTDAGNDCFHTLLVEEWIAITF